MREILATIESFLAALQSLGEAGLFVQIVRCGVSFHGFAPCFIVLQMARPPLAVSATCSAVLYSASDTLKIIGRRCGAGNLARSRLSGGFRVHMQDFAPANAG